MASLMPLQRAITPWKVGCPSQSSFPLGLGVVTGCWEPPPLKEEGFYFFKSIKRLKELLGQILPRAELLGISCKDQPWGVFILSASSTFPHIFLVPCGVL